MGASPIRHDGEPRNAMGEYNPDTWDPDPAAFESGETNIFDPIEGEAFDEPGHWANRDPDMDIPNARKLAESGEFDGSEYLPLISSDMRGVPTEGVQGSYAHIISLTSDCSECGHGYGVQSVQTMAGLYRVTCLRCENEVN